MPAERDIVLANPPIRLSVTSLRHICLSGYVLRKRMYKSSNAFYRLVGA